MIHNIRNYTFLLFSALVEDVTLFQFTIKLLCSAFLLLIIIIIIILSNNYTIQYPEINISVGQC